MPPRILYITSSRLAGMMNDERWRLVQAFKRAGHVVVDVEEDDVCDYDLEQLVASQKGPFSMILFEEMSWAIKHGFNLFFKHAHRVDIPKAMFISDYWLYTRQ